MIGGCGRVTVKKRNLHYNFSLDLICLIRWQAFCVAVNKIQSIDLNRVVHHIILFIFLLFAASLFSQNEEKTIPWSADRKLQWSDYRGSYLKTEWAAATTASGIGYEFSILEKDGRHYLDIDVSCEFFPEKSWYRPELCDKIILSHEQLHFDIAELHARKMRKQLAEAQFTENVKEEVKAIYIDILKQLRQFQNRYDHETDFSRDIAEQLAWNKMISEALTIEKKPLP